MFEQETIPEGAEADLPRALREALAAADPRPALEALASNAEPGTFARALLGAVAAGDLREPIHAAWLVAYAAHALLHGLHDEEGAKEALHWGASGLLATAGGEEAAFELLHDIFELDPVYPPLLRTVAEYHRGNSEPGEALRFFERYLELAPGAVDAAVAHLRCAEIALSYDDADEATRRLEAAVAAILPEAELSHAAALVEQLEATRPGDDRLGGIEAMLTTQASAPAQLERDLHRWSRRAQQQDRTAVARRLGRLREIRLGDVEGAILAYQNALRGAPADLESLDGLERVLKDSPLEVLRAARAAVAAAADDDTLRGVHRLAARVAWRAGDAEVAADHRLAEARLSPADRTVRRRATATLRALGRYGDLIEVLGLEAAHGDRIAALLAGAEVFVDSLDNAGAALAWAEEGLRAAREGGREQEVARARDLVARILTLDARPEGHAPPARALEPQPEQDEGASHRDEPNPFGVASSADLLPRKATLGAPFLLTELVPGTGAPLAAAPQPLAPVAAELAATLGRGRELHARGEAVAATYAFEEVLREDPRHREALERLAALYAEANRTEAALECVERLLALVTDLAERAGLCALRALWSADEDRALRDLRAALDGGLADSAVLDLWIETAKVKGLTELAILAEERRTTVSASL